jgi:hypothetical protein
MHIVHNANAGRGQRRNRRHSTIIHYVIFTIYATLLLSTTYTSTLQRAGTNEYKYAFGLSSSNNSALMNVVRTICSVVVGSLVSS